MLYYRGEKFVTYVWGGRVLSGKKFVTDLGKTTALCCTIGEKSSLPILNKTTALCCTIGGKSSLPILNKCFLIVFLYPILSGEKVRYLFREDSDDVLVDVWDRKRPI